MSELRIVGETWQEFIKKNNIRSDGTAECVVCKRKFTEPTDWYYLTDTAVISWKHDNCSNTGPCRAVMKGESAKEILGIMDGLL